MELARLIIAVTTILGAIGAAWVMINLKINTNKERVRAMESDMVKMCAKQDALETAVKLKADRTTVNDMKQDLLRELGGKIDTMMRMLEAIAKKNGLN